MTCVDCQRCHAILGKLGQHHNVVWSRYESSPSETVHGFHANTGARSLCLHYEQELRWARAMAPKRTTVYVGHPLSGDFNRNQVYAGAWVRYLRGRTLTQLQKIVGVEFEYRPLISAPWLVAIVPDSDYPGGRDGAIADCKDLVVMFDEFWAVGGQVSDGMRAEMSVARQVRDLTHLGKLPPEEN